MRKDRPLFSILIPVYNVSQYLHQCLDSVKNQTFTDWEAICVDDASTDNSLEILQEYAKRDSRFVIINHDYNKNLYAARSTAIQVAKGKYTTFLDSDDYLNPKFLETGKKLIESGDYLLVRMGFKSFGNRNGPKYPDFSETISGNDFLYGGYVCLKYPLNLWGNIYHTEMLKETDVTYEQSIFDYEDVLRLTNLVIHSNKKIRIETNKRMYYYRFGSGADGRKSYTFQDIKKIMTHQTYTYEHALNLLPTSIKEASIRNYGAPDVFCSSKSFYILVEKMATKEDFLKGADLFCKIYGHELFYQHLSDCHIVCLKCSFSTYLKEALFFLSLAVKHIGKTIINSFMKFLVWK